MKIMFTIRADDHNTIPNALFPYTQFHLRFSNIGKLYGTFRFIELGTFIIIV